MKKTLSIIIVALSAMTSTGCNNAPQASASMSDAATENKTEESAETTAAVTAPTTDVTFFDLTGNVKMCTITSDIDEGENEEIIKFDSNGNFISRTNGVSEVMSVERDKKGRIVTLNLKDAIDRTYAEIYEYDKKGYIISNKCDAEPDGLAHHYSYTYSDGRIVRVKGWNDGVGDIEKKYEYLSFDDKGNWTERKCTVLTDGEEAYFTHEYRVIAYY